MNSDSFIFQSVQPFSVFVTGYCYKDIINVIHLMILGSYMMVLFLHEYKDVLGNQNKKLLQVGGECFRRKVNG